MEIDTELQQSIKTIAKGAGITFTGIIAGNLLGTINQVLLGRFLGVNDYGHFNLALSVVNIAQAFAIIGLSGGIARFIPFYLKKGEMEMVKSTIRFSLRFVLTASLSIGVILFLFSKPLAVRIFHDQSSHFMLKVFLLGLPLVVLPSVSQAIIRSFKATGYKLLIYDTGMKIVRIVIFVPSILMGNVVWGAVLSYFGGLFFALFASLAVIRRKLFPRYREYRTVPIAKKLLSFSWPLGLTSLTSLAETRSDFLFIGYFLTSKEVGLYAPALVIAQMFAYVSRSFEFIFLPVVSEFYARENKTQLALVFKSVTKWMFIILLLGLLLITAFPKEIIVLLYGKDYSSGWTALVILAVGFAVGSSLNLAGNVLVAAGHTRLSLASEVIAAIAAVVLDIVLIPMYGIVGAAIASCAALILRGLSSFFFAYTTEKIHPFNRDYLKVLAAGAGGLAIAFGLKFYLSPLMPRLVMMIAVGLILCLIYIGLLLIGRVFDQNDRLVLDAVEQKTGIKMRFLRRYM